MQILRSLREAGITGNIAVKLTQLGLDLDPQLCLSLTHDIAAAAAAMENSIEIDMEGSAYTEATLRILEEIQKQHGNAGVAVQAYLFRSQGDLHRLAPLKPKIRLVKGAYREPASIAFQKKSDVDGNYRTLLNQMLDWLIHSDGPGLRVAVANSVCPANNMNSRCCWEFGVTCSKGSSPMGIPFAFTFLLAKPGCPIS